MADGLVTQDGATAKPSRHPRYGVDAGMIAAAGVSGKGFKRVTQMEKGERPTMPERARLAHVLAVELAASVVPS